MEKEKLMGMCEECSFPLTNKDELLPEYSGLYECPECGHPNAEYDLWGFHKEEEDRWMEMRRSFGYL